MMLKRVVLSVVGAMLSVVAWPQFNVDLDKNNGLGVGTNYRDDLLWSAEAANVVPRRFGNVSLLAPSRYGLTDKWELSTNLVPDIYCLQLYAKRLHTIYKKTWYVASKFNVASSYLGFKTAQNNGNDKVIDTAAQIPPVIEIGHELIVSRVFRTDPNCTSGNEWLVLTAGLGTYAGLRLDDTEGLPQIGYHFVANRGETLTDFGATVRAKLWADWLVNGWLIVRGGPQFWFGTHDSHFAFELHGYAEAFINRRLSVSAGLAVSVADYSSVSGKAGIAPIVDLTYYIGKKARQKMRLFDPSGKLY